jgi:DNA-binding CsgD family transcriptional regulator
MSPVRPTGVVTPEDLEDLEDLSWTEHEVLSSAVQGYTRRETAGRLRLSVHTIGRALTSAKEKLGARSIAEAAARFALLTESRRSDVGDGRSGRRS